MRQSKTSNEQAIFFFNIIRIVESVINNNYSKRDAIRRIKRGKRNKYDFFTASRVAKSNVPRSRKICTNEQPSGWLAF